MTIEIGWVFLHKKYYLICILFWILHEWTCDVVVFFLCKTSPNKVALLNTEKKILWSFYAKHLLTVNLKILCTVCILFRCREIEISLNFKYGFDAFLLQWRMCITTSCPHPGANHSLVPGCECGPGRTAYWTSALQVWDAGCTRSTPLPRSLHLPFDQQRAASVLSHWAVTSQERVWTSARGEGAHWGEEGCWHSGQQGSSPARHQSVLGCWKESTGK